MDRFVNSNGQLTGSLRGTGKRLRGWTANSFIPVGRLMEQFKGRSVCEAFKWHNIDNDEIKSYLATMMATRLPSMLLMTAEAFK